MGGLVAVLVAGLALWVSPAQAEVDTESSDGTTEFIQVKLVEKSLSFDRDEDVEGQLLTSMSSDMAVGIASVEPLVSLSDHDLERLRRADNDLPDLRTWFKIGVAPGSSSAELIAQLQELPGVETAEPAPVPALDPADTPDFTASQGYLGPAPGGIDAEYAWTFANGAGAGVTIYDVERVWNQTHEDLAAASGVTPLLNPGDSNAEAANDNNHGTAVIGQLIATENDFGVTGISHDADLGLAPHTTADLGYNPTNAILLATADASAGDVILLEVQNNVCGLPDGNYGPIEWSQSVFDAVQTAVANGIVVVAAAGNGSVDLDQVACDDRFDRNTRDSGAIIVGAGGSAGSVNDLAKLDFSSYGSRVDMQGWGENVMTTGYGTGYSDPDDPTNPNRWYRTDFAGTSSASPIVAGAAANLQAIAIDQLGAPLSPTAIRDLLRTTGTPQQGDTSLQIGPRPDLRAAINQMLNLQPPVADIGGPYITDEGQNVTLDASGSTPVGDLTFEWDLDNDMVFDDAVGAMVPFTNVADDGVFPVRVRVTSSSGQTAEAETTVTVRNVLPTVVATADGPVDENSAITVSGTITDPGTDTLTATIDWGDGAGAQPLGGELNPFAVQHVYGDDGVFTVVICANDDRGETCANVEAIVNNVRPSAEIDKSSAVGFPGESAIVTTEGSMLALEGRATDPGSDDLTVTWSWDDGSPDQVEVDLNNPPNPDPDPSPDINPRDVLNTGTHVFDRACLYQVQFGVEDDDGGDNADTVTVIVRGDSKQVRSAGYWYQQVRSKAKGSKKLSDETMDCYRQIVNHISSTFSETRSLADRAEAEQILAGSAASKSSARKLDRQLLAAWFNYVNGSIELDDIVDVNGDRSGDISVAQLFVEAESVRNDPDAGSDDLLRYKDILDLLNNQ